MAPVFFYPKITGIQRMLVTRMCFQESRTDSLPLINIKDEITSLSQNQGQSLLKINNQNH